MSYCLPGAIMSAAHTRVCGAIPVFLIARIKNVLYSRVWHCGYCFGPCLHELSDTFYGVLESSEGKSTNWCEFMKGYRKSAGKLRHSTATQTELVSSSSNQRNCNTHFVCGDSTTRIQGMVLWGLDRLHKVKWNPTPALFLQWGREPSTSCLLIYNWF